MSNNSTLNQKQNGSQKQNNKDELDIEVKKEEELILDRSPESNQADQQQTPQSEDEQSVSGHMPGPSSDNNALDAAKKTGLYSEATEEEPVKVGVAEQVEKDEEQLRNKQTVE